MPAICNIHELHIWRLTPKQTLATVHIVFNTTDNFLVNYDDINRLFRTLNIDNVTIQPEFSIVRKHHVRSLFMLFVSGK
jgi:Co/Zn/Cd efflux system component